MNNIEELKKAANAIGHEKWIDSDGEVTSVDYLAGGDVTCDHICNCESFNGESANAKFIALANPAAILDLIAQLEAAQKELSDLHNQEFQQRLANAEHQLYMKDLAIHNIKASRKAQFRKRLTAEAELSAANERLSKPVVLPDDGLEDCINMWPENWRNDFDTGYNFGIWRCEQNIKAAGFTVEGE
ncbi:TPA: hypothetical protein U5E40_003127 [Yersinia enterocolitica]|nr:hypothetical protein [Yersinia enterocolitica]